jgi:hypothetical protein
VVYSIRPGLFEERGPRCQEARKPQHATHLPLLGAQMHSCARGGRVVGAGWGGVGVLGGGGGGGVRNVVPEVPVRVRVVRVSRDSHCRVDIINANNVHALERREAEADLNGLLAARACE